MVENDVILDLQRKARTGLPEAIFCAGKTVAQIERAMAQATDAGESILLTHLDEDMAAAIQFKPFDFDPTSRTAIAGTWTAPAGSPKIAIVCAGTSDLPIAAEAERTLSYYGAPSKAFVDVGVAGLWRLLDVRDELAEFPIIIAIAGMEGALFSVLGGLVPSLIIAVPTSRGYGICREGEAALHSALGSCAQGLVAVNINNGYGAACAAIRSLGPNAD